MSNDINQKALHSEFVFRSGLNFFEYNRKLKFNK